MKVRELIDKLASFDQDADVEVDVYNSGRTDWADVRYCFQEDNEDGKTHTVGISSMFKEFVYG